MQLLGTALGDVPPSGINWPSDADYVVQLSRALDAIEPVLTLPLDEGGVFTPPLQSQAAAVVATVESAAGLSVGQLVSLGHNIAQLAQATSPPQIVAAVGDLVNGTLDVAMDIAEAFDQASEAFEVVPVLSDVLQGVFLFVKLVADSQARYKEYAQLCQRRIDDKYNTMCAQLVADAEATPCYAAASSRSAWHPCLWRCAAARTRAPGRSRVPASRSSSPITEKARTRPTSASQARPSGGCGL